MFVQLTTNEILDSWSFDRKTLLDDKAKAQELISDDFTLKCTKTADLVSQELVTETYQGRPMKCMEFKLKCVHFTDFNKMYDRRTLTKYGNSLVCDRAEVT